MRSDGWRTGLARSAWPLLAGAALACDDSTGAIPTVTDDFCSIPAADIIDGGPGKDGIPALTDPPLVAADDPDADYLLPQERVIGLVGEDGPLAVPVQILWWHEIVNLDFDGMELAVTHCPLTGSSLVFDRAPVAGAEFGVSGLLFRNNLIMYDRTTGESLWPQMSRGARCGPRTGTRLTMIPSIEMTWEAWRAIHPDTRVVSDRTGYVRDYRLYPYGGYRSLNDRSLLFSMSIDERRPPKELVLGVPDEDGGVAYPFGELELVGPVAVVNHGRGSASSPSESVLFWDLASRAAAVYRRSLDGFDLDFEVSGAVIVDTETGSEWRVDGFAVSGPHAGRRLEPVTEAYTAYWFAWAAFEPGTLVWDEGQRGFPEGP